MTLAYWVPNTAGVLPGGGGADEVYTGDPAPSPRADYVLWIDPADTGAGSGAPVYDSNVPGLYNDALGHPFLAWSFPPIGAGSLNNSTPQNQQVCLASVYVPKAMSVSRLTFLYTTKASGLTAGHNFLGLYSSTVSGGVLQRMDLVGQTAPGDLDAALSASAWRAVNTLTLQGGPFALSPGFYYTAFLVWYGTGVPSVVGWRPPLIPGPLTDTFMPCPPAIQGGSNLASLPASITSFPVYGLDAIWMGLS